MSHFKDHENFYLSFTFLKIKVNIFTKYSGNYINNNRLHLKSRNCAKILKY